MRLERPAPSRDAVRGVLLFLLVELIFSAAFLNYFCRAFEISRTLLLIHIPVAAFLLGGTLLLGVIPAAAAASLLLIVYLADFASQMETGSNITYKVIGLWWSDFRKGGNILALSPWIYAGLSLIVAVVFAIHIVARHRITEGRRAVLAVLGARRPRIVAGALLAGYVVFFWQLSLRTPRSELLTADPVLAFMRKNVDVYDDRYVEIVTALKSSELAARAAYPKNLSFNRRNVIVIIVDSLRADHMGVYGYERPTTPFLSKLEDERKLRRVIDATSTCAESNCGILSTLFSKKLTHQIPEDFSLFNLLKDQGYTSNFILAGNHDWRDLREMYGHEHSLYFDGRDSKQFLPNDDRVIFEGLDKVQPTATPAFFYFHLMSVHLVGTKLDEFRKYEPSKIENDWNSLFAGAYDRQTVVNNYDNGVLQADATIERLFKSLDAKGFLKDSLVVVLADHGEGLGERARTGFGHITSLYQEFITIPMLIYDDPSASYSNLSVATQIDVAPTILERLGLPIPSGFEGVSMVSGPPRELSVHQTTLKSPCFAMVYRPKGAAWKYLSCFVGRREEIYNLVEDPGEQINVRDQVDPALVSFFRESLSKFRGQ